MTEEFLKKAAETEEVKQMFVLDKVLAVINANINKRNSAETANETVPLEAEIDPVSDIANNVEKDDYYDNIILQQANKCETQPYVANDRLEATIDPV